ncbi:MAG: Crp/Fnr family transcriptional regulator [Deltaproteobacteria bacterium]
MSKKELEMIQDTRYEVTFKPDEVIYKQGTKTTQIVSITGGLAKAYIEGINHKNFIIELIKPTTVISGPGTYVDYKHHFSLKAVELTNTCFFDLKIFKEIVSKNSKISDLLLSIISKRSISYFQKFISITQKQVNGRIAENLLYLYNNIYQTNPMELTVSFQDIAEMTGMSKDTVVRVLKDLCNENLILLKNNQLTILNHEKLNQLSELG